MNIYLASSWKNKEKIISLAKLLRDEGFNVDAFCDISTGRYMFNGNTMEFSGCNAKTYLKIPGPQIAFIENKKWLDWCDICILCLPSGNSSHIEGGYAYGRGKSLIIYHLDNSFPIGQYDAMYGFAYSIDEQIHELLNSLFEIKRLKDEIKHVKKKYNL